METDRSVHSSLSSPHAAIFQEPWIVVADSHSVKIFSKHGRTLHFVHALQQPDMEIDGMDNAGRGRGRSGGVNSAGRHAYDPSMEESRQAELALAREAVLWLDHEFSHQKFKSLVLIAAPQMLGELRQCLTRQLSGVIIAESSKNILGSGSNDLSQEILKIIPGPDRG